MNHLKKLLLILLLTLSTGTLYAKLQGQPLIDSLLKELPKQKEDTNKVNVLNALSFNYKSIDPETGITYGQQALELATKQGWKNGMAKVNMNLGNNYFFKSDRAKALEYWEKSLKIYEEAGNKTGIASATQNIALFYQYQSNFPKALEYYSKALKILQEAGDKPKISVITGNIGLVYLSQSENPQALEYFFKALKMNEEIGDNDGIMNNSVNIGNAYIRQSDYPKALEYYSKALKIAQDMGSKRIIATTTQNIGDIYFYQDDYPNALENLSKALKMYEEMGDKHGIALVTGGIGGVYAKQKNYTMAIAWCQSALKIDEEIGNKAEAATELLNIGAVYLSLVADTLSNPDIKQPGVEIPQGKYLPAGAEAPVIPQGKAARLHQGINYMQRALKLNKEINKPQQMMDCYNNLAEAYKLSGDINKSLDNYENYVAVKDSLFSNEKSKEISKMEYSRLRYGDSLKAEDARRVEAIKLQHQRSYTYVGIAAVIALLAFSFFIIRERGKSEKERKKSDGLLLNILPEEVATELKTTGTTTAKHFDNVTVLFTDFVNFTQAGESMSPQALIDELHTCFKKFDEITGKYNIEKIKTIGDAYLAVCGLPAADPKHAENVVKAAIEINGFMQDRVDKLGERTFQIRIGVHSGSVVAGIVGVKKFAYDIWGDTVNTAARMEQNSEAGKINISQATYELVKYKFSCEYRGEIEAKGKGVMKMYYVS